MPTPPDPSSPVTRDVAKKRRDELTLQASEARYHTLFEYAPIGIVYADAESYYIDANESICRMLGYSRDELIGLHASDIVVPSEVEHIRSALGEIHGDSGHQREWQFRRKDGSTFAADVIATKFPDGTLLGMIQDVTALREHEREIARMSRLYAALSQINQAIVWTATCGELFRKVCRALVEHGGFRMAWIGWHDPETHRLVPVAECGDENEYLQSISVYADDRPEGRGPSGLAFRSGRPYVVNGLLEDPVTLPWRAELDRRGFRASAAFPIRLKDDVCGTLSVYVDQESFFHDKEIALLEEAATDLSFALDNFARDEARRQAEQTVRNEMQFSDTMIESMPGILYFYDSTGRFLRWNRNFETVSGYCGEEIARMHPLDFFSDEEKPRLEERIAEVFVKGEASIEAAFVAKDGTATPYFFTGRRVPFEGTTCLVGVGIDISDRVRIDAEREKRYRAEAADRIKSAFLATMSHELRTPLNSIIGFTGIILQGLAGPLNPEQSKQLDMVRTSARHLLALVNDVLDISKIEAGQLEVAREQFDLRRSIAKVLALVTPQAEAKGLALHVQLAPELREAVSDERRFEQILVNLLSNAIKFTAHGEIALVAELVADLELPGAASGQPAVRLRVSDTGIGIKPEDMRTLFQPFRQIDSGLSRKHEGTGLGLVICRRLAALMGGEISVESEWGKGSTFSVTLPLKGPVKS